MWEKWNIFHGLEFFLIQSMIFPRQSGCPEIFTSDIKIVKNFKKKISDIFVILGVAIICKYYWTCVLLMLTYAMGTSCRFAGWSNWVLWYYLLSHGLPFLFRLRFSFSGFSFLRIQVLSSQGSVCFWIHGLASEVLVFIKLACSIFSRFIAKYCRDICFLWFKVTEVYGRNMMFNLHLTGNVVNRTCNFIIKVTYAVSKL